MGVDVESAQIWYWIVSPCEWYVDPLKMKSQQDFLKIILNVDTKCFFTYSWLRD